MKIEQIQLKNYTCFSNKKVNFFDGVNLLVGRNGAGKSSVIDAIGIAVFNGYSGSLKSRIKHGQSQASIKCKFSVGNQDLVIVRSFGNVSSCTLKFNKKEITGIREVYEFMSDLLRTDSSTYFRSALLKSSDPVTLLKPDKKFFDDLFMVDKYNKSKKNLLPVLSYLKNKITEINNSVEKTKEFLEVLQRSVFSESEKIQLNRLIELQDLYKNNLSLVSKNKHYLNNISNLENKRSKLLNDVEKVNRDLISLHSKICPFCKNNIKDNDSLIKDLENKLSQLRDLILSIEKEIKDNERKLIITDSLYLIDNSNKIAELKAKESLSNKDINKYKEDINKLNNELSELNRKENLLIYIRNRIPLLISEYVTQKTKIITDIANKVYSDIYADFDIVFDNEYKTSIINENGYLLDFDQLSSGQKMIIALCIILSIIVSNNRDLIFLDEPSVNLDKDRMYLLPDLIQKFSDNFNQIFIITHSDSFDMLSNNTIKL